ncbi:MAG TPA: hypothetical protein VGJ26_17040 [Pirellulales bacterium]|jgi:hypothetical protein
MFRSVTKLCAAFAVVLFFIPSSANAADKPLWIATFKVDATPPVGSPLCDGAVLPVQTVDDPLSARGLVLLTDGEPIVLCAVDWVGIGNSGYDAWRQALADAAGTSVHRVALHTLHQHDAPGCDFLAEKFLADAKLSGAMFDVAFARRTIQATADAVRESLKHPRAVTHLGLGRAKVDRVAANRRVLGPDGKVKHVRWSFTENAEARAAPEGDIDPWMQSVSFWDGDKPLVDVTYYATHPQSWHNKGAVSGDTIGLARAQREREEPEVTHIHFNGASGNITVGKYYDGTRESRAELAGRLADGMRASWKSVKRQPIAAADVGWRFEPVELPVSPWMVETELKTTVADATKPSKERVRAAMDMAWMTRCREKRPIDLSCLRLGSAYVVHMPAELFIEYQLAAQRMRPDATVLMAAYGDYGPGYIGTEISYTQGGYETGIASRTAPQVERVLTEAMGKLLQKN